MVLGREPEGLGADAEAGRAELDHAGCGLIADPRELVLIVTGSTRFQNERRDPSCPGGVLCSLQLVGNGLRIPCQDHALDPWRSLQQQVEPLASKRGLVKK